jgi:hypothetical protein
MKRLGIVSVVVFLFLFGSSTQAQDPFDTWTLQPSKTSFALRGHSLGTDIAGEAFARSIVPDLCR